MLPCTFILNHFGDGFNVRLRKIAKITRYTKQKFKQMFYHLVYKMPSNRFVQVQNGNININKGSQYPHEKLKTENVWHFCFINPVNAVVDKLSACEVSQWFQH